MSTARILLLGLVPALASCRGGIDCAFPHPDPEADFKVQDPLWDITLNNTEMKRVTVASRHLFIESNDHWLVALDRFSGLVRWKYWMWRGAPALFQPVEARGGGVQIIALRKELDRIRRRIGIERARPQPNFALVAQLDQDRNDVVDRLAAAHVNDNLYFISDRWLYCLECTTGRELWYTKLDFVTVATPLATRKNVFVPGRSQIRIFDVNEKRLVAVTPVLPAGVRVTLSPVYHHPLLIYAADDGLIRAWDVPAGILRWAADAGDPELLGLELIGPGKDKRILATGTRTRWLELTMDGKVHLLAPGTGSTQTHPTLLSSQDRYFVIEDETLLGVKLNHSDPFWLDGTGWSHQGVAKALSLSGDYLNVLTTDCRIRRIDVEKGWASAHAPVKDASIHLVNRYDGIIYVGHHGGRFAALDPEQLFPE